MILPRLRIVARNCVLLIILNFVGISPGAADVNKGAEAFQTGNYVTALKESRGAAENGDVEAQFLLGLLYGNDYEGIPQNDAEAARWLRLAAVQDYEKAQQILAVMYSEGLGVPQDYVEAYTWSSLASRRAMNTLAAEFRTRISKQMTSAQIIEAEKLTREWLYFKDRPTYQFDPNDVLPIATLLPLAEKGDAKAQTTLAVIYAKGRVKKAQTEEAMGLFYKAAKQGYAYAQFYIGLMHAIGHGVKRDYVEAARWYHSAAQLDNVDAQFKLGTMNAIGQGVPKDLEQARHWHTQAAEKGSCHVRFNVGMRYVTGDEAPLDYAEALRWFRSAAEQGFPEAQNALGDLYANGNGVSTNHTEAMTWYRLSANQGFAPAAYNMGMSYSEGRGVERDYVKAYYYFSLAYGLGDIRTGRSSGTARTKMSKLLSPDQLAEGDKMLRELPRFFNRTGTCPLFY
ncbi:MAG TPA: SEL1-like repeat protein, partial [Candidatus Binatus sp.]|nr:SEL1-like repeat protein [Candidatus Binatus sp.]